METPSPTYAAERFTSIIEGLCEVLRKHGRARFIAEPLLLLIWNRLMRLARRFANIAERVRTGTISDPAPARGRDASAPSAGVSERRRVASTEVLPRHFRWLVNMVPEAAELCDDLCWLMQRLEMRELIFAAPQIGRIMRPVCKMLGVEPTAALRLPVRAEVRSAAVVSETEAASAQHVDGGGLTPWGGPLLRAETEDEAWEADFRKSA